MTADPATLLLVEDDPIVRTFLADNLTADGYDLMVADSVRDALRVLELETPELAVVDVAPARRVGPRSASGACAPRTASCPGSIPRMPFVVLSGCDGELDRVRGFEHGADDYVTKPFAYGELRLRIAALLRRSRTRSSRGRLRIGTLDIDPGSRAATVRGHRVDLAAKEFALLRTLAAAPTRVFTKEELLRDVWGFRARGSTRTLDSHACRLRNKLREHGDEFVVNVWGVGYRLVDGPLIDPHDN